MCFVWNRMNFRNTEPETISSYTDFLGIKQYAYITSLSP